MLALLDGRGQGSPTAMVRQPCRWPKRTACCTACRACRALVGRHEDELIAGSRPASTSSTAASPTASVLEASPPGHRPGGRDRSRQRRTARRPRRGVGRAQGPVPAHRGRGGRSCRARRRGRGGGRLPRDPAGPLRDRPDGSARPRQRRHPCDGVEPRARSRRSGAHRRRGCQRGTTPCSRTARCAPRAACSGSSTRLRPRSANSATMSASCAPQRRRTACCASLSLSPGLGSRCSATPAGRAWASSASPTATR